MTMLEALNDSNNIRLFLDKKLNFLIEKNSTNFIWLYAKDNLYYEEIYYIREKFRWLSVAAFPTEEEIREALKERRGVMFIAPYHCPDDFKNLIVEFEVGNFDGVLTSQEIELGVSRAKALQERLGISVIDSPYKLSDVGGADKLKEYVALLQKAEEQGFNPKGIFLVGIPGTGKTFFPTCLAGELNRPLIMLNLEVLKESGEPLNKLNQVFEFLNSQNERMILLIDEIEKMIGDADDPLTGRLMTILSALGDKGSEYKNLKLLIFATANSLNAILDKQPAFLRRGRFDELFFVNLPTFDMAKSIFEMYIKKLDLNILTMLIDLDELMVEIDNTYRKDNSQPNKFCYTPAEIESFLKRIAFLRLAKSEQGLSKEDILGCIKLFIPIITSAKEGIDKIAAQRDLFVEI